MSQNVSSLSNPIVTVPALQEPGRRRARSEPQPAQSDPDEPQTSLVAYLFSDTAASWYLSLVIHVVGYLAAAFLFVVLGNQLIDAESETSPIRASLDDFDRDAEQPKFETLAELSVGEEPAESPLQRLANNLSAVEEGLIDTFTSDDLLAAVQSDGEEDGGGDGFLFSLPESGLAVTKGSFTVWTEPERPRPGQRYLIIIEVRLPKNVRGYRITDLKGRVVGTDKYTQKIPYDANKPHSSFYTDESRSLKRITGGESLKVRKNKVQLAIQVPGARRLVRDTIEISSRRLRERQKLELVFGQP